MDEYTKDQFAKYVWQPLKAVICAVHLYPLYSITLKAQESFQSGFSVMPSVFVDVFTPLTMLIVMVALWKFYDGIDDVAFISLCREENPQHFLKRMPWLLSLLISTVGCGIPLGMAFWKVLAYSGMDPGAGTTLCMVAGCFLAFAIRGLLIFLLFRKWNDQKVYYRDTERYPTLVKRILQAVAMTVGLVLACMVGMATFFWAGYTTVYGFGLLFITYLWPIFVAMVLFFTIRRIRLLSSRKKFLKRLRKMQEKGDIHYDYMGHPYLSVLFRKVYFALIITDYTDGMGANKKPKTYRVVMIGTQKRRQIIACENNTYQYKHEIRLRMKPSEAVLASASKNAHDTGISFHTWYTTYGVSFPATDVENGECIMIFDPVPYGIYTRSNDGRDTHTPLDNGSKVYGYTVWSKNSFANYLDRS